MAKKVTQKTYSVSKRFDMWVEAEIKAESMTEALVIRDNMGIRDFVEIPSGGLNDYNELPGGGVHESW